MSAFHWSLVVGALAIKRETQQRLVDGHHDLSARPLNVGADEHHEAVVVVVDEHRMVEVLDHVVVVDAVVARTRGDQRRFHDSKLACRVESCKLACHHRCTFTSGRPSAHP